MPHWYLKRFVDSNGFLHVYDKEAAGYVRRKPREVMAINRYYRQAWAPKGVDPDVLEKRTGQWLEPRAREIFDKLLTRAAEITENELPILLLYLEFQRLRVPRQAKAAENLHKSTILACLPPQTAEAIARGDVKLVTNETFRFDAMRLANGKLTPYLTRMRWEIIEAPPTTAFVTTDSPVSFINPAFILGVEEPGLALAGTYVLFPLNSRHLAVLQHPENKGELSNSIKLVPEAKGGLSTISVTSGRLWSNEEVTHHNHRMLRLAARWVVAPRRDTLVACVEFG